MAWCTSISKLLSFCVVFLRCLLLRSCFVAATQINHKWHPSFWTSGCPFLWWTWLCLWDFLCALRLHWPEAQIHLLRKFYNYSCTWGLASAAYNWVIGLYVNPWLPWPDVLLFLSCWVFVLYFWGVCCCGAISWLPHSLVASSCSAWLTWRVLISTFSCWVFCLVCFCWLLQSLFLCVIACCGTVHCCWPSVLFGRVVFYAPCVLLTYDCWVESRVVLS